MSKALQVREMIAQAKAQGNDAVSLIPAVMQLGFKRQLARAYINNNWDRVEAAVIVVEQKPAKALSMSRDAIRKREARAAKRAAAAAAAEAAPAVEAVAA